MAAAAAITTSITKRALGPVTLGTSERKAETSLYVEIFYFVILRTYVDVILRTGVRRILQSFLFET